MSLKKLNLSKLYLTLGFLYNTLLVKDALSIITLLVEQNYTFFLRKSEKNVFTLISNSWLFVYTYTQLPKFLSVSHFVAFKACEVKLLSVSHLYMLGVCVVKVLSVTHFVAFKSCVVKLLSVSHLYMLGVCEVKVLSISHFVALKACEV